MKRTKKKYSGVLSRPSRPKLESEVGNAVLQTDAEVKLARSKQRAKLEAHAMEGLQRLCWHYKITDIDPVTRFMKLSLCLAGDHVPYFWPPQTKPGPKKKFYQSALLLTDVEIAKAAGAKTDRAAILKLLKRKEWCSYDQDSLERMLRSARKTQEDPMAVITSKLVASRDRFQSYLGTLESWRIVLAEEAEKLRKR